MAKKYFLAIYFFLGCLVLNAQVPCSDFNDPVNPAGNWTLAPAPNDNVNISFGSPNSLDGTQYLVMKDESGGSWYQNTVDYRYLGERFPGQCLCFDYYLGHDGGFGSPIHPSITLSNANYSITFVATVTVTPGSGWVRVCAPLVPADCSSLTFPGNSQGSWTGPVGMTCDEFNSVMYGGTTLSISPDITSYQTEVVMYDNICVRSGCTDCSADFKLDTSFSTLTNSASANLTIINPDMYSTPGNPGSTYVISWGDGSPSQNYIFPSLGHNYTSPGTYTVCVTQIKGKQKICTRCFTFCFAGNNNVGVAQRSTGDDKLTSPLSKIAAIAQAELKSGKFILVPNPAKNYVDVQTNFSKSELVSIKVIDILGKVVFERSEALNSGLQTVKLNTEKLVPGTYIVEIKSGSTVSSQKLLISE